MLECLNKYRNKNSDIIALRNSKSAFCYHSISKKPNFKANYHNVSISNFENHLNRVRNAGFKFLGIDEFLEEKIKGKTRSKITSITFDDGYKNVIQNAVPILERLRIPAAIFLSSQLLEGNVFWRDMVRIIIENDWIYAFMNYLKINDSFLEKTINQNDFYRSTKSNEVPSNILETHLISFLSKKNIKLKSQVLYVSKPELEGLNKKLFSIGNHTHSHYRMSSISKKSQDEQIKKCQRILETLNVTLNKTFAIPFGENGSFNKDTIELVEANNFTGFLCSNQQQFGKSDTLSNIHPSTLHYSNRVLPLNKKIYA